MQKKQTIIAYSELNSPSELQKADEELLRIAEASLESAYAPYSQFKVGAALMLENGIIVKGSNQENMAFPSGLCAERVAVFAAASAYPGVKINALAITAFSDEFPVDKPVPPCGGCRQVLIEFENNQKHPIRLILGCQNGKVILVDKVADLLPLSFNVEKLKK